MPARDTDPASSAAPRTATPADHTPHDAPGAKRPAARPVELPAGNDGFYYGSSFERISIDRPRSEPAAVPFSPGDIPTEQAPLAAMLAPGFKLG